MQRILLEDRRGKHVSNDERSSIGSAYRKRYSIRMAGCHQPLASHAVKKQMDGVYKQLCNCLTPGSC